MVAGAAYHNGDVIGRRYRVHRVLGKGGFGLVYLVTFIEDNTVFAFKTFRDEYIFEDAVKSQFKKEALIWLQLGMHPFIVQAHHIQYFDDRMFVAMDHVPGDENGLVSVHDHIVYHGKSISDHKIGTWIIQFCNGMEHAQSLGVIAHRDIKPTNLLVGTNSFLKISDFGLVASLDVSTELSKQSVKPDQGLSLLRTDGKRTCGTPGYIAPEIFRGERAGVHSDIFSFGITLWQLAAGTTELPYRVRYHEDIDRFTRDLYEQQIKSQIIPVHTIFWPIISKCLNPDTSRRFSNYDELHSATKSAMKSSGIVVTDFIINKDRTLVVEFINRGASYRSLGLPAEALRCYEQALALEPNHTSALVNKSNVLSDLGNFDQALSGYDAALRIDPKCELAWLNRALHFQGNGQHDRAIRSLDQLIKLNPQHALAFSRKGFSYRVCGRVDEALQCYKSALKIRPQDYRIWTDYGEAFSECGRGSEAIQCYDKAISFRADHRPAWINKAKQLIVSGQNYEGM
ncbi:tetratricopeptide repeat protein, partial [Patescibacteria group bacterium]|nr:tetratricopeptide repeat protein [Patescibacteria group bacterium]